MSTMTEETTVVTGGVDTHRDFHVAAALDHRGGELGTAEFAATAEGYRQLRRWLESFGEIEVVGVEGTGTYGRGLARHLQGARIAVVEVDRPNRQNRRRKGKNDTIDAVAAARAAQGGDASAVAKAGEGPAEALRALQVLARAVRIERIRAISQLRALVVTAPDELRARLHGLPKVRLCQTVAHFRVADPTVSVDAANRYAMRSLGRRAEELRAEAKELKKAMAVLVDQAAPGLLDVHCVGPDTAATLVVTAGANPQRLRSEASFAKLCGSAPLEASTGGVVRHRLSRAGDRQANAALYRIAIVRLAHDNRTRDYVTQRTAEGKSKLEAIRCLKRYIARELYPYLQPQTTT